MRGWKREKRERFDRWKIAQVGSWVQGSGLGASLTQDAVQEKADSCTAKFPMFPKYARGLSGTILWCNNSHRYKEDLSPQIRQDP